MAVATTTGGTSSMSYKRSQTRTSSFQLSATPRARAETNSIFQEGLLSLPNETLLEIISYFPPIGIPEQQPDRQYNPSDSLDCYTQSDALHALSQTCQAFRKKFLPLLWQQFDVYTRNGEGEWYKRVSRALERRSKGLMKNKELSGHVQTAHVVLTRCSTNTVLPAFARCLSSLPNLHTLEVLHAHSQMTTALKDAFQGKQFPSIRTVILPSCAHNILRCCPEVRSVKCTEEGGSKLVGAIAQGCKKVEALENFRPNAPMMKRLVKAAPNLRCLKLGTCALTPDIMRLLSPLKYLTTLEFVLVDDLSRTCIEEARKILQKTLPKSGVKSLRVRRFIGNKPWAHMAYYAAYEVQEIAVE